MKKLSEILAAKKNHLCVGLDPDLEKIPHCFLNTKNPILSFLQSILEVVTPHCSAIKPNFAFFEALGLDGLKTLKMVLDDSQKKNLFVIGDVKRADIGNTSRFYAKAFFKYWNVDAITVPPYMGYDSITPFLDFQDKLTYILCVTSNKGANDFQLQKLLNQKPLYHEVFLKAMEWNLYKNVGLVVGAPSIPEIASVLKNSNLPLLIPGIGTQGGKAQDLMKYLIDANQTNVLFNQSRSIIYPQGNFERVIDFQEAVKDCVEKAAKTTNINK